MSFNSNTFLNQESFINLFSDEKKQKTPEVISQLCDQVNSLEIFIEDLQQILNNKDILNSQHAIFKNLTNLTLFILNMNRANLDNLYFIKLIQVIKGYGYSIINSIVIENIKKKSILFYFDYISAFYLFLKNNNLIIQLLMQFPLNEFDSNISPFNDEIINESNKYLKEQEHKNNNEFYQMVNQHENSTSLFVKQFSNLECSGSQLLFAKISSFLNLEKLQLEMNKKIKFSPKNNLVAECLISLTQLEVLELVGYSIVLLLCQQMNQTSSVLLEKSKIHTIKIKTGLGSLSSVSFLSSLKLLQNLSITSYGLDILDLSSTLIKVPQLNHIKLKLKVQQKHVEVLINSISSLTQLQSLALTLICETSENYRMNLVPQVLGNLINLEKLSMKISNHQFEQRNWLLLLSSLRFLQNVTELNFSILNQMVSDTEFIELSHQLRQLNNLKNLRLDFGSKNKFGDEGLIALAENITFLTQIKHIYLVLLSDSISRIGTLTLQQSISQLQTNPFVHLEISDYETLILQYLKLTNTTLPLLQKKKIFNQLCSNKYKVQEYQYTQPFLQHNFKSDKADQESKVKHTNLQLTTSSQTNLGLIGIQGIFNGLSQISKLTSLYLKFGYNQTGTKGINLICEEISKLMQLKELSLHLEEIKMEKQGVISIYSNLKKLIQLDYLSLFLSEYFEISEESNFFDCMPNLVKLILRNQENVELLFDTLSNVRSLKFLMLVQHHSFTNKYTNYLDALLKLQSLEHLNLYIDLNFETAQEKDQILQFFDVARKLENLFIFHFTFNTHKETQRVKEFCTQELLKMKRLVSYSKNGFNFKI